MTSHPRLRVVMVVRLFSPWVGGMERQAQKLASSMNAHGIADVRIVTGRWFRGTPSSERIDGVDVHRNHALWGTVKGLRKLGAVVYMFTLFAHLVATRRSYDVIHVHGLSYHTAVCRVVSMLTGRPMIVKLANAGEASDIAKMERGQHLPGTRFLLGLALGGDRYVALNPGIAAELATACVDIERIVSIPNGVEIPGERPASRQAELPLRLVFVGRLHAQKSLDTVIRALGAAPTNVATLDVVGDGPEREGLETMVREKGLAAAVTFHGSQDDVASFLASAHALVLASRSEGISNALLEAMALGTPGIVSDIPGNTAVVEDRRSGFVFRAGDHRDLADVICTLAADPQRVLAAGEEAFERVKREFSLLSVARRYRQLYEQLDIQRSKR